MHLIVLNVEVIVTLRWLNLALELSTCWIR